MRGVNSSVFIAVADGCVVVVAIASVEDVGVAAWSCRSLLRLLLILFLFVLVGW